LAFATDGLAYYYDLLSAEERARSERMAKEETRRSFIAARGMLRCLLGWYLHRAPDTIVIGYEEYGKPAVPGLHFNLSHCDATAVFAFSSECPIGVDVERVRSLPDRDRLAEHFFAAEELTVLESVPRERRDEAFFHCWTRKEAYIKAVGRGVQIPLDSFAVTLAPDQDAKILRIDGAEAERDWQLHALPLQPGYVGALAYRSQRRRSLSVQRFPDEFWFSG
jgi:4'-phosphopantetheinyl transferase